MEFSTLVQFSKLVSDSPTAEGVFSLLAQTVVEKCNAFHALVFGTGDSGDFCLLSSYGGFDQGRLQSLALEDVDTVSELRVVVAKVCGDGGLDVRIIPLISEAGLFGALGVLHSETHSPAERQWMLIDGLTELTAISLNKAYQHQRLQKAFDDLRLSQEALVRTEKFRALGQMSAGIAHDLKNILSPLLLYTGVIQDAAADTNEVRDISGRMERILNRGLETVERLRDFSRQSEEEIEASPIDLNAMVHEAVEISKPRLKGISTVLELGQPAITLLRAADCVTAIVNLIVNSADALDGKGTITIRTGSSDGGGWVEIADSGPGIPAEIRAKILEPFFTTKGDAGTGLGLSIVYAFTQRHGGHLDIQSEPGQGARFRMWFPAISTSPR